VVEVVAAADVAAMPQRQAAVHQLPGAGAVVVTQRPEAARAVVMQRPEAAGAVVTPQVAAAVPPVVAVEQVEAPRRVHLHLRRPRRTSSWSEST
jgi:hypothetical protein